MPKDWRRHLTSTEKMDAARAATQDARVRETAYAAILARIWPSQIGHPRREDALFPHMLLIESPAGPLTYRLSDDDLGGFEHVPRSREEITANTQIGKLTVLLHLATEGW